ncbi:hypothetical protein LCGC14_0907070 [marine sediment metagenome]|uniref:Uncharacterized protein n=1 Tax=marine sediment metagenome TaxID=412755 RepID=A0A0F9RDM2_9ZZZZ
MTLEIEKGDLQKEYLPESFKNIISISYVRIQIFLDHL